MNIEELTESLKKFKILRFMYSDFYKKHEPELPKEPEILQLLGEVYEAGYEVGRDMGRRIERGEFR